MPVKLVACMERKHVEIGLDGLNRPEMAGAVEVHTAVGETGLVVDFPKGKSSAGCDSETW